MTKTSAALDRPLPTKKQFKDS